MNDTTAVDEIVTKMELLSYRLSKAQRRLSSVLDDLREERVPPQAGVAMPQEAAHHALTEVCTELKTLTHRAGTIGADLRQESACRNAHWFGSPWREIDKSVEIPFTD